MVPLYTAMVSVSDEVEDEEWTYNEGDKGQQVVPFSAMESINSYN